MECSKCGTGMRRMLDRELTTKTYPYCGRPLLVRDLYQYTCSSCGHQEVRGENLRPYLECPNCPTLVEMEPRYFYIDEKGDRHNECREDYDKPPTLAEVYLFVCHRCGCQEKM